MNREEIESVLKANDAAYDLVIWLSREAKSRPDILNRDAAEQLDSRSGCRTWLETHRTELPEKLRPNEDELEGIANLFWSYFQVSFTVSTMEWHGDILDADVKAKAPVDRAKDTTTLTAVKIGALKRLFRDNGVEVSERRLRSLAKSNRVEAEVSLWTYTWELRQRARGKSKGGLLHRLWRSLEWDTRKSVDTEAVLDSVAKLLAEAQHNDA